MTCVLPYRNCNQRRFRPRTLTMPCVFDGCEPLDFESALLSGDWPTQTKDNSHSLAPYGQEDSQRETSGSSEKGPVKRKYAEDGASNDQKTESETESKKPCMENEDPSNSSAFTNAAAYDNVVRESPVQNCPASTSSAEESVHNHPHHHEVASQTSMDEDDDMYLPRRRIPQMWNSRQRWKDERKKVLKLSINKLTEIEDPELWLLRSVLINNTIKRLHQDIRTERQAKIRHRQQKIDFYSDRYEPPTGFHRLNYDPVLGTASSSSYGEYPREDIAPKTSPCPQLNIYDENSCDELFGINEDFLRVTIPDRRVSSPIPTTPVQDDHNIPANNDHQNEPPAQMDVDQSSSESTSSTTSTSSSSSSNEDRDAPAPEAGSSNSNANNSLLPSSFTRTMSPHQTGSQCATQFRTNNAGVSNLGIGESGVFPPRVPILDSVVYHSLLASLESS